MLREPSVLRLLALARRPWASATSERALHPDLRGFDNVGSQAPGPGAARARGIAVTYLTCH